LGKLGNHFFPTATSADYMDLISWVMGRTPLPDKNNVGAWLVDAMKPMEKKAPEATDHTYSYNLDYQFSKKFDNSQLTVGLPEPSPRKSSSPLPGRNHPPGNIPDEHRPRRSNDR